MFKTTFFILYDFKFKQINDFLTNYDISKIY